MSVINAIPLFLGDEGYQISRSVRLRSSASAYFNRTPASAGNRRTFTWSGWVKLGTLGTEVHLLNAGTGNAADFRIYIAGSKLSALSYNGTSYTTYVESAAVLRDPSSWYHIVAAIDTTQATSTNRVKLYINGVQVTAFSQTTYMSQNFDTQVNNTVSHAIGRYAWSASNYFDGYLTEINFIDGYPTGVDQGTWASFWGTTCPLFGETNPVTGVWQPKKYAGTYGTNGFYLNFSDNSAATAAAIGKDYSGNGNNWTPNNISLTAGATYDSMLDVPTQWADGGNGRGNYATLNPLDKYSASSVTNGNLYTDGAGAAGTGTTKGANSTISVTSGKWYWEVTQSVGSGSYECRVGIWSGSSVTQNIEGSASGRYFYRNPGGNLTRIYSGTSFTDYASYYGTFTDGDVLMFALDVDSGKMWLGKNGTWFNNAGGAKNPATGTNADWTTLPTDPIFVVATNYQTTAQNSTMNFGQRGFAYTPPSGFKALNTLNLPTPTILKGNQYFNATIYTGSTGTNNIVNSGGMQPDLVWVKNRQQAYSHYLYDAVRGTGSKALLSNSTGAEGADSTAITSFNSNGFTFTGNSGANDPTFANAYVGWQWKEGATQGFDIVTFTSDGSTLQTVAHNLGVSPDMIIVKPRSAVGSWGVYHKNLTSTNWYLNLNSTAAQTDGGVQMWGRSSSNFQLRSSSFIGANGTTAVAYLFAEVAGFSKFGSYTGNGSADGPFVFCGFRPRWLMIKSSTGAENWRIIDTARNPTNVTNLELYPNTSNAEGSLAFFDFLSNGFKVRDSGSGWNLNGGTYIFAAFAENPFKNALAR